MNLANADTGWRSVTSRFSGAASSAQPSDMPHTTIWLAGNPRNSVINS